MSFNNNRKEIVQIKGIVSLAAIISLVYLVLVSAIPALFVQAQQMDNNTSPLQINNNTSAMSSPSTSNGGNITLGNATTYTASGFIRSVIIPLQDPDIPYITFGYWNSSVNNGNLTGFEANFTMSRVNGSESHNHQIINFRSNNGISLIGGPGGATTIFSGIADVQTNSEPKWRNVETAIIVDRFNTINIALDSRQTDNHFNGQTVGGVVESIKSPEGKELLLIVLNKPPVVIPFVPQNNQTTDADSNVPLTADDNAGSGNVLTNIGQAIRDFFTSS